MVSKYINGCNEKKRRGKKNVSVEELYILYIFAVYIEEDIARNTLTEIEIICTMVVVE